jgi:polygalacturonase
MVTIQNYKVINQRPTTTTFNQTDGVDFDSSTNGTLTNAFLYTGDDNMAVKDELDANMNLNGVVHQHVVGYSNSGGCKIGTKTGGTVMDGIVFKDIDIVKAGRAMAVDGYDTAVVQNTIWQDIRVEAADSRLIDIQEDMPPTWRTAANQTITKNSSFTNVTSAVDQSINLHGKDATTNVNGVHFTGLMVKGKAVTAQTASWSVLNAVNITFQ